MNRPKQHVVIIAGESSGDLHGAHLIHYIKQQNPKVVFSGLGGIKMEQEGFQSLVPITKLAIMGFWEVLKNIMFFINLERLVLTHIQNKQPDKIILIDYPGFNLRLAQKIKKISKTKIIYYVSPQLWAWKEERVKIIKKHVDSLIVLFPFEVSWYKKHQIHANYFGHPLIEQYLPSKIKKIKQNHKLSIALCPGSRIQEIQKHLPILIDTAIQYTKNNPQTSFKVICAPNIEPQLLRSYIKTDSISIETRPILTSFQKTDFAIVASGTAALECAVTLTPMFVVYKMSLLSWWVTKGLVKAPFASIVNILAAQEISLELLQTKFTAANLLSVLNNKLTNYTELIDEQTNILETIKPLAIKNTYQNTARYIESY